VSVDAAAVESRLMTQLAAWSAASVAGGAGLWLAGRRRHRDLARFGLQQVAWGAVDGAIAAVGFWRAGKRTEDPDAAALRRLLLVNAALDVGYVAGGAVLAVRRPWEGARGDGAGIVVQGGFLLVQDVRYARQLPR
jgi:hypothetical protein